MARRSGPLRRSPRDVARERVLGLIEVVVAVKDRTLVSFHRISLLVDRIEEPPPRSDGDLIGRKTPVLVALETRGRPPRPSTRPPV